MSSGTINARESRTATQLTTDTARYPQPSPRYRARYHTRTARYLEPHVTCREACGDVLHYQQVTHLRRSRGRSRGKSRGHEEGHEVTRVITRAKSSRGTRVLCKMGGGCTALSVGMACVALVAAYARSVPDIA
eukprot:3931975-Rhodomonas_salina.3